jgi:hypothetical protein
MDGYALAHAIKERHPHSKIIMSSGFPGVRFGKTELANSLPLLSKPYRTQALIRLVRQLLGQGSARCAS